MTNKSLTEATDKLWKAIAELADSIEEVEAYIGDDESDRASEVIDLLQDLLPTNRVETLLFANLSKLAQQ